MGAAQQYQNQLGPLMSAVGAGIFGQPGQIIPQQLPFPPAQCPIQPDAVTEARWWLTLLIGDRRLSVGAREKLKGCLGMLELAESTEGHP